MKKTVVKLGLCALLASHFLASGEAVTGQGAVAFAATVQAAEAKQQAQKIKGKITNISQKAKTIALANKDNSFFLIKFNDQTILKGVESSKDFKVGEAILVKYLTEDGENVATSLEKALVKLPAGTKEIKTKELVDLMASNKDLVVIDARPPVRYAENHIPGAVSIPYSKFVKMGDDGAQLLEKYKDKELVFYCGGPT